MKGHFCALLWVALVCLPLPAAKAQLPNPQLLEVFPAGGVIGSDVEVKLRGRDIVAASQLRFSHPGITAKPKMDSQSLLGKEGSRPLPNEFVVSVARDVPAGLYEVRAVGHFGLSTPRAFHVGQGEHVVSQGDNRSQEKAAEISLACVVNGVTAKDNIDYYRFQAKSGQRIFVEGFAERIDSRLDATLEICDAAGRMLGKSRDFERKDPFLDIVIPRDGEYYLKVYDFLYAGGAEHFYRCAVRATPYVDFVFPPCAQAGEKRTFTLYGRNLPGGKPAEGQFVDGVQLERLDIELAMPAEEQGRVVSGNHMVMPHEEVTRGLAYRISNPQGKSNAVPIPFATAAVVEEIEPNNRPEKAQRVSPPCEVVGQFYPARDRDWITFDAKKNKVYFIEVLSQRLGLLTDPVILVQKVIAAADGKQQVSDIGEFDVVQGLQPPRGARRRTGQYFEQSEDPRMKFVAPEDGSYRVMIRDYYSGMQATARHTYRLVIREPSPDFRAVARFTSPFSNQNSGIKTWSPVLRRGGTTAIQITVFRQDEFQGEIEFVAKGLPAGVTQYPAVLPAGSNATSLILEASESATLWHGEITIEGKARIGDREIVRVVQGSNPVWDMANRNASFSSRMTRDIGLSVIEEQSPVNVKFGEEKPVEVLRAGKTTIPIELGRLEKTKGDISLAAANVPKEIRVSNIKLNEKTKSSKVELTIDPKASPGRYALYLQGVAKVSYRYFPEYAKQVAAEKAAAQKQLDEATKANNASKAAQQKADEEVAAVAKQLASDKAALAAEEKKIVAAQAELKVAAERLAQAQKDAEAEPGKQELAQAVAVAQQQVDQAQEKQKQISQSRDKLREALASREQKAKAAGKVQQAAKKSAQESAARLKQIQDLKKIVDKRATDAANLAKPKDLNMMVISNPVIVEVAASPVKIESAEPKIDVEAKQELELPIKIARSFGYKGEVDIKVVAPPACKGLTFPAVKIGAEKNDGKLTIKSAETFTAGTFDLQINATVKYNNQSLSSSAVWKLTVNKVPATTTAKK